ncbi:MAG: aldolase/citrate lyase family protein [Pseudomonadota bacterium]|nr:aldolase/citrate lyase family protein [Pseudomonadota bacterium]
MTDDRDSDPGSWLSDVECAADTLPVCDHYAGIEARMTKSFALQAELGPVFDVTLDCEDGAPVGGEVDHAHLVAEMAMSARNRFGRCGVRVHPVDHPAFESDVATIVGQAASRLAYVMLPKVDSVADVDKAASAVDAVSGGRTIPLHALIETHAALRHVASLAAHPRIESLSFGLMDFVSAHRGAIPASAMSAPGQFAHPLVVRAKLEIAAACHAFGKVPSHSVVTEFADIAVVAAAARRAIKDFGFTRMWSIHPSQIRPIVAAFAPEQSEVDQAIAIIGAAADAGWAPIRHAGLLQDRASYRYWWRILILARRTGAVLPAQFERRFFAPASSPHGVGPGAA